jgi:hypothetical protein
MRPSSVPRLIMVASALLWTAILAAEDAPFVPQSPSFGTSDLTYVRVPGAEFLPRDGGPFKRSHATGRYPVEEDVMIAAVYVPGGSIVDYLQIDFCDTRDPQDILLSLFECDPSGTDCSLVAQVNSFADIGCSSISTSGFNHQVDNLGHSLILLAQFLSVNDVNLVLTGVVLGYRLQVSPAPATATFNDVPTGHPFFQYIEALAASGITGGCQASPPLYCPDNPLTRGQMAVFLAKALGLHWPN